LRIQHGLQGQTRAQTQDDFEDNFNERVNDKKRQLTLSRYCQVKCESPSSVTLMKTYNGINQLASLKLYPGSLSRHYKRI
jgi:hypothetical protein